MLSNLSVAFGRPWFLLLLPFVLPPLVIATLWEAADRGFRGKPLTGVTMRVAA